jgi:hypothetical protein
VADTEIDFDAPAILRKWPSLNNERISKAGAAFLALFLKARWMNASSNLCPRAFHSTCIKYIRNLSHH